MPGRILIVQTLLFSVPVTDSARYGWILPSAPGIVSVSYTDRATWMPPIASCALYRQYPPLVSASMPYVRFPPATGVPSSPPPTTPSVVVGPFVVEPPPLELLPHADAITASAA